MYETILDEELGNEVLGSGTETSQTITRLILKTINGYTPNVEALTQLVKLCKDKSIDIVFNDSFKS